MKRGFLNTQKAKKRAAEAVESEATTAGDPKSKDKKWYVATTRAI